MCYDETVGGRNLLLGLRRPDSRWGFPMIASQAG